MSSRFKKPRWYQMQPRGTKRGFFITDGERRRAAIRGARRLRRRRYAYPSIKQEPKFYDTSLASTSITYDPGFASLEMDPSITSMISTPAVGDSEQNRDGKKIVITQVEIKGSVVKGVQYNNQSGIDDFGQVWVALVLDTQTNNLQMNSEDCFKSIGGATVAMQPFRNLLFGNRFRILKMKRFTFNSGFWSGAAPNISQEGQGRLFTIFKKLRLPVNFNAGTSASVSNVLDNSLHVIAWASDANYVLGYSARIRFVG